MINLAGIDDCDATVAGELALAGVPLVLGVLSKGEVRTWVLGKLGPFTFRRAWRYWMADGPVPIETAEQIYATDIGKHDVRAGGDCACRPPSTWCTWRDADGLKIVSDDGMEQRKCDEIRAAHPDWNWPNDYRFVHDASLKPGARCFVEDYHIDSQEGLVLFVSFVKPITKSHAERCLGSWRGCPSAMRQAVLEDSCILASTMQKMAKCSPYQVRRTSNPTVMSQVRTQRIGAALLRALLRALEKS